MSQNTTLEDPEGKYIGECRNGHTVYGMLNTIETRKTYQGKHFECNECGRPTYCPRYMDDGVVERDARSAPFLVSRDDPNVVTFDHDFDWSTRPC